jgi:hypothetical protein
MSKITIFNNGIFHFGVELPINTPLFTHNSHIPSDFLVPRRVFSLKSREPQLFRKTMDALSCVLLTRTGERTLKVISYKCAWDVRVMETLHFDRKCLPMYTYQRTCNSRRCTQCENPITRTDIVV